MFRHPQLAALERRKWDLTAKSASLRDDLLIEAVYWKKVGRLADAGIWVFRLFGLRRHWAFGMLGVLTAWFFKRKGAKEKEEEIEIKSKEALHSVLDLTKKVMIGWKIFNYFKTIWQKYRTSHHIES